jgi:hypothetical protein
VIAPRACWGLQRAVGRDRASNMAVERTAGSHALAAAAHRRRSAAASLVQGVRNTVIAARALALWLRFITDSKVIK